MRLTIAFKTLWLCLSSIRRLLQEADTQKKLTVQEKCYTHNYKKNTTVYITRKHKETVHLGIKEWVEYYCCEEGGCVYLMS